LISRRSIVADEFALNVKLCANAKLQSDKSCPAVANGPTGSVVR
jgi:hypothetical protein